jgi:hypothetical protein
VLRQTAARSAVELLTDAEILATLGLRSTGYPIGYQTLLIGARILHNLLERAFHLMQALWDVRHVSLDVPQGLIRLVERRNDLAP